MAGLWRVGAGQKSGANALETAWEPNFSHLQFGAWANIDAKAVFLLAGRKVGLFGHSPRLTLFWRCAGF